jgi:hypothetical protein
MKLKLQTTFSRLLLLLLVGGIFNGCKEDLSPQEFPALTPANNDITGGTWKTIIVKQDDITVPQPKDVTSTEYVAELADLKTAIKNRTSEQLNDAKYWASGAVLRWNEIARLLVAKYNVAPRFNSDSASMGTTPFPLNDPPYGNPCVASRIYACLSVAQYDALVATWKSKYQYNRPAPSKTDGSIEPAFSLPDMPSYPSEHASIAIASCEVLKFFFPKEVAFLEGKAMNHVASRLWAGANVSSDNMAGDSIGRFVAAKVIARAKADGAGAAGKADMVRYPKYGPPGNPLYGAAGTWISLDLQPDGKTARPGLLPAWGKVKMWGPKLSEDLRIAPPPAIGSAEFAAALAEVKSYSENRTREQWRIVDFWADGLYTCTPPGHWNMIADTLIRKNKQSELRTARTYALMNMAIMDAGISCWDNKYFYNFPRPTQMDPSIKTATGIPNFPSYTSGHATFSSAAATILSFIFPSEETQLWRQANEAAMSRLYGCIHYRFDDDGGIACGKVVANEIVNIGKADGAQ